MNKARETYKFWQGWNTAFAAVGIFCILFGGFLFGLVLTVMSLLLILMWNRALKKSEAQETRNPDWDEDGRGKYMGY